MLGDIFETIVLPVALRILLAAVVVIIGGWIARLSRKWVTRSLEKTALSESFVTLIKTAAYYGIWLLVGLVALGALGVPVTALAGAVGIIVVVLAIALQQQLGNLAATVIIMLFKPFEVGNVIETGGLVGAVHEIQMLNTVLSAPDGKTHIVPNAKIQAAGLTNYSTTGRLRLNLAFRIGYGSDVAKAKEILSGLLAADERILPEPPPRVFVQQLADNGVEVVGQAFAETAVQGLLQTEMVERVKNEFEAAGILIPHPQQDVHLFTHS